MKIRGMQLMLPPCAGGARRLRYVMDSQEP